MALAKPAFNTNQSLIRHVITYMGMTGMPFAMDVASVVPVAVNAGQYSKRKLGEILDADAAQKVGNDGRLPVQVSETDTGVYACEEYAPPAELVRDRLRSQALAIGDDPAQWAMRKLLTQAKLNLNKRFVNRVFSTDRREANWGRTRVTTPTTKWGADNSTPIEDIREQIRVLEANSGGGGRPIHALFGRRVWDVIQDHPQFVERLADTGLKVVTEALVAQVLGIQMVRVANDPRRTSVDGLAEEFAFPEDDNVLLCVQGPTSTMEAEVAVSIFEFRSPGITPVRGMNVRSYYSDERIGRLYECRTDFDIQIVDVNRGFLFYDTLG